MVVEEELCGGGSNKKGTKELCLRLTIFFNEKFEFYPIWTKVAHRG